MTTLLAQQSIAMLETALAAEFGIIVSVSPRVEPSPALALRAKQTLYRFTRELAPAFDDIQIRLDPLDPDHRLWLIRRRKGPPHG
jgi:hypothetical protein